ncbi:MAG: MmgE/PrpD family protein [Bryobacteraceae bacterium]|nr:MmgE/PrpD family protein [Bryobacteraceae bacterium]
MSAVPASIGIRAASVQSDSTVAERLADFAHRLKYRDIPASVVDRAKLHMLDAIGTALVATRYDFARDIHAGLKSMDETGNHTVLGMDSRLPLRDAVLMNAALAHGLDYDDTHMAGIIHPSASALPCALGVAEHIDASGQELLAAYVLGVESAIRVGKAAKGGFHHIGFHPTGLCAHFSCALLAGRLLGLAPGQLVMAQGIVGSTAAASHEFRATGAWNKRLHPGWAGVAGITAAKLAKHGFIAPSTVYEGKFGLYRSHLGALANDIDFDTISDGLGEHWEMPLTAIKPFPVCHFIHASADAALTLRARHNLTPAQIARIRILLPQPTMHIVADPPITKRHPTTDYQAKFSAQFSIAACLVRGRLTLAELEPEVLNDKTIAELADRTDCEADPTSGYPRYFSGGVVITTEDGRELRHMEPVNRGAEDRALTSDEITAKFMDNACMVVSKQRATDIRTAVLETEKHTARALLRTLA